MHELAQIRPLLKKITEVARTERGSVRSVVLRIGALCPFTAELVRLHVLEASKGTVVEGAQWEITSDTDPTSEYARDILLESIEFAE